MNPLIIISLFTLTTIYFLFSLGIQKIMKSHVRVPRKEKCIRVERCMEVLFPQNGDKTGLFDSKKNSSCIKNYLCVSIKANW